jgi:hypothetical protein
MEDTEWRNIADALSVVMGMLRDITAPMCQVKRIGILDSRLLLRYS